MGEIVPPERLRELLSPYYPDPSEELVQRLAIYLELLLRWGARMNLTSIRDPAELVRRHFGESLFLAQFIPAHGTLLDLGSGAGFPGVPIQLVRPELTVTLGESQNKKASFLREVVRTLELPTEVWGGRVEAMPADRLFDVVAMRAVDDPRRALLVGRERLRVGGVLALLTTDSMASGEDGSVSRIPNSEHGIVELCY